MKKDKILEEMNKDNNLPTFSIGEIFHIQQFLEEIVLYTPHYKDRPYYKDIMKKLNYILKKFKEVKDKYDTD